MLLIATTLVQLALIPLYPALFKVCRSRTTIRSGSLSVDVWTLSYLRL